MEIARRNFLRGTLAAVGGLFLGGTAVNNLRTPTLGAASGDIVVGSLLDGTGPINIYGLPMIDATAFALDDINSKGGVLGRKLRLVAFDTQSTNERYTQYATRLILQEKVAVIHGGITSASREAIRPLMDKYKMLYFYNEQYEGGVCDKYVFCTGVTPSQQLGTLVPWAIKQYGAKCYTIAADYNYGHISADWVKVFLKKNGGTLTNEEFFPLDVTDFSATVNKIQEAKPSFIMSLLVGGNHIAFYRQYAAAGMKDKIPIVSPTLGLGNEQVVLAPQEAQGITVVYPYFQELDNPVNHEFVQRWRARFGNKHAYVTDSANIVWSGWHLWAMAVNKAGSLDLDKVVGALESGLTFDAPEGTVKLDPQSHHVIHTVHLAQVNDKHGFKILQTFPDVRPSDTMDVCNLLANPNQHTQYTPKTQ
jgi:branched-chain amino acid transport system substrate-binding protein